MLLRRIVFGELCDGACKGMKYSMLQSIGLGFYQDVSW